MAKLPKNSWLLTAAVLLFLGVTFLVPAVVFLTSTSSTHDEATHLASGYSYWKWKDYRLNPEHPPFAKMLAAFPLLFQTVWPDAPEPRPEDLSKTKAVTSEQLLRLSWGAGIGTSTQWDFSRQFLFGLRPDFQLRAGAKTPDLIATSSPPAPQDYQNPADRLIISARLAMLSIGLALGAIIFFWAKEMHGSIAGGVLALACFVFDPNFIAHSSLITTDVAIAFCFTGAMYFLWRIIERPGLGSAVGFLVFFALSFATKFSAILLIPMFWIVVTPAIFLSEKWRYQGIFGSLALDSWASKLRAACWLFVAAGLFSWLTVWAFYGFRYSAAADPEKTAQTDRRIVEGWKLSREAGDGHMPLEAAVRRGAAVEYLLASRPGQPVTEGDVASHVSAAPVGLGGQLLLVLNRSHLLPEAWLYGLADARASSLTRPSFLRGETSLTGFRSYFLWTFILKTPLPIIGLIAGAIVFAIWKRTLSTRHVIFLLGPVAIYAGFAVFSNMNIGHRHLLPIYPFLFVLIGVLASPWQRLPVRRRTLLAFGTLTILAVCSNYVFAPLWRPQLVAPHYLAYFNEIAGGPSNGYKSLSDSNLDWGQDLKGLKRWINENHPIDPIFLSHFGTADPSYYQIGYREVPPVLGRMRAGNWNIAKARAQVQGFMSGLRPGDIVAVSANHLAHPNAGALWQPYLSSFTVIDSVGYSIWLLRFEGTSRSPDGHASKN